MPKRRFGMIAIDLDGTLLPPDGRVTQRTRRALYEAMEIGLRVCFATGRNLTESRGILRQVEIFDWSVFAGGAMVQHAETCKVLHRTCMNADLARELCRELENLGQAVLALQDTSTGDVDYLISKGIDLNKATQDWLQVTSATYRWAPTPELVTHDHKHTIRVGIVAAMKAAEDCQRYLTEKFGRQIVSHLIRVPAYGVNVLEVFDPNVSKWHGILQLSGLWQVKPADVIAVGDDMNDLAMIAAAGFGVAMGNAKPQVKALANRVIGSNVNDGLAEFLEELVSSDLMIDPAARAEPVARP